MYRILGAVIPAALSLLAAHTPAQSADYDPPMVIDAAEEYVPVEVGNGWYIRGDIGYKFNNPHRDFNFGPSPIFSHDENRTPINGSVGFGYRFNDYFRMEGNFGLMRMDDSHLSYLTVTGMGVVDSAVDLTTKNEMWTGMVNAYADLGTIAGFTPYVGAGIGIANNLRKFRATRDFVNPVIVDIDFRDFKEQYVFAYSLGAGVNYQLTKNLSLDVGYEYFSAPDAESVRITTPVSYAVDRGIDYHQLKLGMRYALW